MKKLTNDQIKYLRKRKEELLKLGVGGDMIPVIILMEFMTSE